MRNPLARKRLAVEALEDRVVPAAHPVAVSGAGAYRYGDQVVTLDTRADELVVGLPGGAAALAALAADNGPLAGLTADRWLTPELVVLAGPVGRVAAAAAAPGVTFAAPVYQNPDTGGWLVATNEVIVALAPGADASALSDPRFTSWVPLSGTPDQFVVTAAAGYGAAALDLAESLHADPRFAWAAPNFYQSFVKHFTPNDTLYASQWHLNNTVQQAGQTAGADVDAPLAWDVTQGSQNIIVSVVDDGMEMIHADLAPNIAINQGEIPAAVLAVLTDVDGDGVISFLDLNNAVNIGAVGSNKAVDVNGNGRIDPDDILAAAASGGWVNSADGDGNGYVDDLCGWDFTTNGTTGDLNPGADGVNDAHSTSVAGVAVGVGNNNLGTAGMAFRSRMLAVRVFGTTGAGTTDANFASAVYYAAGRTRNGLGTFRAGDVMNNSWGGGGVSTAITAAFAWATANGRGGKGTPSFISSGNDFDDAVSYPSNLAGTNPGVISVGASTDVDTRSAYSNYGPELDFVTPSNGPAYGGVYGIVTTDRTGTLGYNPAAAGNYTNTLASGFGGTSSASPLAAGIGALILAVDPNLTANQVRTLMRASTELIGPNVNASGFAVGFGYGKANANAAVRGVGVAEVQVLDDRTNVPDGTGTANLGSVGVGGVGPTRTFRVRNQGTQTLALGAVGVTGPFEIVSGLSSTSLTTNQYATFSVRFLPTAAGAASGTVTFTSNDLTESTFDFTVTGTGATPSLAGRPFEDWDGDGTADANDPSLAGRQVFLDMNANGSYDTALTAVAFNTGTISVAIPDATGAVATSSQTVTGTAGLVSKITVRASITHTYTGDVSVELVGPTGQSVMLFAGRGDSGNNLTTTLFDDAGSTWIGNASAPFTGTFRPEEALAAFTGTSANGTWTLRVRDSAGGDTGTLTNWILNVTLAEPTQTTAAAGTYAFAGLAAGTFAVRTVVPGGWTATGPAGGSHSQTLAAGGSVTGLDFGSVRQNAVYGQMVNDLNGNGVRDGGEPVMAGWRVFDDRDNDGVLDGGEVNAVTDASGNYVLTGLAAGATRFRVERQAGYRTTLGVAGLPLTVVAGSTYHTRDFGAVADTTAPTADVTDVSPDPRTSAVGAVTIVFGEAVTGFDLADLTLRRDGGSNLLTGSQTLTTGDNVTWTLGNLAGLTAAPGSYVLTLTAAGSGVQDAAQNALAGNASDSWVVVPVPTVSVSDVTAGEAGGPAVFTVTLSNSSPDTVTVSYATADGTATVADGDYTAASGTLTFAPGETSKAVSVPVANDARNEAAETFVLNLGPPTNATTADGQGLATITDDDPLPALAVNAPTLTEGTGGSATLVFTVSLSAASGRTVTVSYGTDDGTATVADGDYTFTGGSLTFLPGETSKTVAVPVAGDTRDEPDETFTLTIGGETNATLATPVGTGTITDDDDPPALAIGSPTLTEGTGGSTAFAFTVSLSAASGRTVTVNYATADGTATVAGGDFTAASGALTFAPGETTKTVTVQVTGDARDEPDEAFAVTLSGAANATIGTAAGTGTITDDDDPPALAIAPVTLVEGTGVGTAFVFTVSLSAVSGKTVTVNYATATGTATAADFTAASGSLTFAPGETSKTVTVQATGDALDEDNETFTMALSGATNATVAAGTATGTITDDDLPPSLSIGAVTQLEGTGGSSPFVFTVSLSAVSGRTVTVNYATAPGTAAAADFTAASGSLTFAPGETSKTITVQATGDALDEDNETFTVALSGATNATVAAGTATGTITDDDLPPSLSIGAVTQLEGTGGSSPFVFTVSLSAVSGRTVTVNYATAPGTATAADFTAASGSLTFAPGETSKTITVQVTGDALDEDNEAFTVALSGASNATVTTGTATGTITDDDLPPALSIGAATLAEGTGGSTAFTFAVSLSAVSGKTVTVNYGTADGTATLADGDFTAAAGTLTFAPGATTQTFTVAVAADARNEDAETFGVTLTAPANATLAAAAATGTITDDDPLPTPSVNSVSLAEGTGGATAVTFAVSLSAVSGRTVTVSYATADGTATVADGDFTAANGSVTFAPGETTKTVTVQAAGDARNEDHETFALALGAATNAVVAGGTGTATLVNDDPEPTLAVDSVVATEGVGLAFTVSLSAVSGRTVTVNYSTADGTAAAGDYAAAAGTLTFLPGQTSKTVTIATTGDDTFEADETFTLTLSGAANAGVAAATGSGTVANDDAEPTATLSGGGTVAEAGGSATVVVTLSNPSYLPVTVTLAVGGTAAAADFDAPPPSVTIPAGQLSAGVTVAARDDADDEPDETVTLAAAGVLNGSAGGGPAAVTITDDDAPVAAAGDFDLTEDTPFAAPTSLLAAANAQPGSVAELVGAAPAGGILTLNADGTFAFAPAADANGTVGFTYRVRNPAGEASAPAAVALRVTAVNDAPAFAAGADQTDPRRGGPQVVPGWATGISAGPADESGQRLTFEVTTDTPGLFAVPPAIDPATGVLTYTPGGGFGTAGVTVRLRDAAGGADTSPARTFTIRVLKYRDDDLPTSQNEVGLIGVGSGDDGTVAAFRGDGAAAGTRTPFTGASARVATADVTGDGIADTITATGPGVRSRVVVTDGATGAEARTILPFEDTFTGGLFVAAADVDGDGKAEIAVSPDTGGGGRVTVFGAAGAAADFFGIDDTSFRGGARVAFGDVNGDGTPDLVVVAGFGGGPRTAIYDGTTLAAGPRRLVSDFFAFPGTDAVTLRNGVFVAAGDVDGDGFADLAFGGGPGGAPRVFVLSGALVSAGRVDAAQAAPVGNFFVAGNSSDRGGVRVAVKDADGDDRADVVAGSGEGSAARVRVYAGSAFGGGGEPGGFFDLEPFGGAVLAGGVYVG